MLNVPALGALKETFVNARIIAVVALYVEELAKSVSFIDETVVWEGARHNFLERLRFINLLKQKKIDIAVMLNPSREFNVIAYLAGIPVRVGYARKWGFLLTHKIEDRKHLEEMHEVESNLRLAGLVGAKTSDKTLSLSIDDDIINSLCNEYGIKDGDILVGLHPWTSDPVKQWPPENFIELAKKLLLKEGVKVVIIGGKEELSRAGDFSAITDKNLVNFVGKTSLNQLAALLKRCSLLISGDSGPVHLASAAGIKVLAIFRNDMPGKSAKRWGPWGSGHIVIEKSFLSQITVEEIFSKAREVLSK